MLILPCLFCPVLLDNASYFFPPRPRSRGGQSFDDVPCAVLLSHLVLVFEVSSAQPPTMPPGFWA